MIKDVFGTNNQTKNWQMVKESLVNRDLVTVFNLDPTSTNQASRDIDYAILKALLKGKVQHWWIWVGVLVFWLFRSHFLLFIVNFVHYLNKLPNIALYAFYFCPTHLLVEISEYVLWV